MAETAKAVREGHEASTPIVARHGGRIVKTTGDGVLMEFPSLVAAVECAIAIQKLMTERNAETTKNKRILYRMGVNLGDVLVEDDDIVPGDEHVNIAARLEEDLRARPHASFGHSLRPCARQDRRHPLRRSRREGPQEHRSAGAGLSDPKELEELNQGLNRRSRVITDGDAGTAPRRAPAPRRQLQRWRLGQADRRACSICIRR